MGVLGTQQMQMLNLQRSSHEEIAYLSLELKDITEVSLSIPDLAANADKVFEALKNALKSPYSLKINMFGKYADGEPSDIIIALMKNPGLTKALIINGIMVDLSHCQFSREAMMAIVKAPSVLEELIVDGLAIASYNLDLLKAREFKKLSFMEVFGPSRKTVKPPPRWGSLALRIINLENLQGDIMILHEPKIDGDDAVYIPDNIGKAKISNIVKIALQSLTPSTKSFLVVDNEDNLSVGFLSSIKPLLELLNNKLHIEKCDITPASAAEIVKTVGDGIICIEDSTIEDHMSMCVNARYSELKLCGVNIDMFKNIAYNVHHKTKISFISFSYGMDNADVKDILQSIKDKRQEACLPAIEIDMLN